MTAQRQLLIKPTFLQNMLALPGKELHQIMEKVNMLTGDPEPAGKVKVPFQRYWQQGIRLYRLRAGHYRVFYTFDKQYVAIWTLRRRDESTYEDEVDLEDDELTPEELAGLEQAAANARQRPDWDAIIAKMQPKEETTPFPEPITEELLTRLRIPKIYHARLLPLKTREALYDCHGLDDETILRLDEYMFEKPIELIQQEPTLQALGGVDDLLRYKEGELLDFLLKLSPEQEQYTRWPLHASGPTMVKGGPGTGKSTVALYRIRSLLQQLLQEKSTAAPRILFTTYTNALVKSSMQLLQQLLGDSMRYVRVQTADTIATDVLHKAHAYKDILDEKTLQEILHKAVAEVRFEGSPLQQRAQRQALIRMGNDYLRQEIDTFLVAREVESLLEYQCMARTGRKYRLNGLQREAVWRVYERWKELVEATGQETWQQRRVRAARLIDSLPSYRRYDAVVIDEAQDLEPAALRLLVKLCKAPNRLFITADANQSIYGSSFSWKEVHQDLNFQGHTNILKANYRSTQEIDEAAHSYLTYGALEPIEYTTHYVNSGPMPDVRAVLTANHEIQLLKDFFTRACNALRLTHSSCAVLCPSEGEGRQIADDLRVEGLEATFMSGSDLNLKRPGIKVLTLKSAKGLEFPVVAIAGFLSGRYPVIDEQAPEDEQAEMLARERRTMYVAMTRAMRALLVVVPAQHENELLTGFDSTYWNLSSKQ
uniref:DNA 3'-5' helicase n=1 Tax=Thermosporothrix sp. COM3 TaxID=2490863 RepID=A0A455SH87_9CHLR|nr:DNA helicase [Thermosporothrix sp. COM3]